jgi:AIPR protein
LSEPAFNPTIERVAARLHQIFDGLIVISPNESTNLEKIEKMFRSRAYMALALLDVTEANPVDAAAAITDGGDDGGIDCVYISEKHKKLFLGQSKFLANVEKGVDLGEFNRFRDGVKDVLNQNWTSTNAGLHKFKVPIQAILSDIDAQVVMLFAHTSAQSLSDHIKNSKTTFLEEMNRFEQFIEFEEFTLDKAAAVARKRARPENINVQLMLKNWGVRRDPYRAVYGAVPADDIVRIFHEFGSRLFSENLRFGIEKSEVNDGIRQTAKDEPQNFWYFNNGITAICEDFRKAPVGGQATDTGIFDVTRISIINGAQTVSSLARSVVEGADLTNAEVHVRVISLTETPEDLAVDITTANNTQNDLSPVDFVAADPNQDRLRREAASLGKVYTYRRGEGDPNTADGFTIRDATVAAACASGDLRLAVAAKRYISGLWENTSREPYTRLFNDNTTAEWLWMAVIIMRQVDDQLAEEAKNLEGRDRLISVHANRFILFTVFREIAGTWEDEIELTGEILTKVRDITRRNLAVVTPLVNDLFADGYPGNVFKNRERQEEILTQLDMVLAGDPG